MSSPIALGYADSVTLAAGQLLRVTGGGFITHGNPTRQSLFRGSAVFGPFEVEQVIFITASQSPVSYGTFSAEGAWLGSFASLTELQGAFPAPAIGDYATLIDGSDVPTIYRFGTSGWIASAGGGGGGGDVSSVNGKTGTVVLNKADVGLGNASNLAPADYPVSDAQAAAIATAAASGPVSSVAGKMGAVSLAKGDVGLGNVDNTADSAKPVSTAQAAAIASAAASGPVSSVAGKTGAVTLAVADVSGAAPAASPALTGTPTVPTAAADTNTTQAASTAYVIGQASSSTPSVDGTAAVGTSTRYARADHVHPTDTSRAPLASPTFTGTPSLPTGTTGVTQTAGDSSTKLATTAFVTTADNLKAPLASPALTGTPTAPTASGGTNTTQIATTAFVTSAVSSKANTASPTFTGTPAAPTASAGTNTTQIATMAAIVNERSASKTLTNTTLTAPTITSPTITATDTSTSGSTPNSSLTVTYTPSGATTKQQSSFNIQTNYSGTNAVSPGGWVVSAQANNTFNSNAAIDKSVVYTGYTSAVGGAQIDKALGFEAVMSGLDGTSNINQYAAFYSANVAGVTGINRVNVYYAFANDYAGGLIKNVGRYVKATKTSDGSVLREVGPTPSPGYVTGRYYGPLGATALTPVAAVPTAVYAVPFYVYERTTFTEIGFRVTTSIAGNARVGIYYGDQGKPTDLIVDSGDLSTSTTGAKTKSISVTLEAGLYFLVFHASAGVTINYATLQTARDIMGTSTDNGNETTGYTAQTYGALPSTMPALTYIDQASNMPFVWLRK